jgi:hypothetical protein
MARVGGAKQPWVGSVRRRRLSGSMWAVVLLGVITTACSGQRETPPSSGTGAPPSGVVAPSVPPSLTAPDSATPMPSLAPADRQQASSRTALALLATVPVKGRAPNTAYSRAQFGPSWTDDNDDPDGHNGCDTRNDILRRDLSHVTIKAGSNGCTVLTGTLHDPYTGRTIAFVRGTDTSSAVQIDHVVALDDAWQKGAQQWSSQKRTDLANDPLNLLAVDGPTNEAKGDGDAATWLPPNSGYRCAYVARQVAVKARYGLWMTRAEHDAIADVLADCPDQKAPTEAGSPPNAPGAARTAAPPAAPRVSPASPAVKAYANCAALNVDYPHGVGRTGAHDHTSGSHPVTDFTVNDAVYEANQSHDGDKDGIACERA